MRTATVVVLFAVLALGVFAEEPKEEAKDAEPHKAGKKKRDYKSYADEVVEAQGAFAREVYESDIVQDYIAVPAANLKKAAQEGRESFNQDPYVKQAKQDMTKYTEKAKDKIRRFVESVGDITKTAEAELSLTQTDSQPQPIELDQSDTIIKLATSERSEEGMDARSGRVRTLAAAKQLMKLMNVAAMSEERAKELIDEARKADAEADLVRAPIQDNSDKKARYHRAKTLQNAQTLNVQAAQAVVKARKLAGMVRELKEAAKKNTAEA